MTSLKLFADAGSSWAAAGSIHLSGRAVLDAQRKTIWGTLTRHGLITASHVFIDGDWYAWLPKTRADHKAHHVEGSFDLALVPGLTGDVEIARMPPIGTVVDWHGGSGRLKFRTIQNRVVTDLHAHPGDSGSGVFHAGKLVAVITHGRPVGVIVEAVWPYFEGKGTNA